MVTTTDSTGEPQGTPDIKALVDSLDLATKVRLLTVATMRRHVVPVRAGTMNTE